MTKEKKKKPWEEIETCGKVFVNVNGDIGIGFEVTTNEPISGSEKDCSSKQVARSKAMTSLASGTLVHWQHRFTKNIYIAEADNSTDTHWLQEQSRQHFNGRTYLQHKAYCFILLPHGSHRPPISMVGVLVKKNLVPQAAIDRALLRLFEERVDRFVHTLEDGGIRLRLLEPSELLGTPITMGLLEPYSLLSCPGAMPVTQDIDSRDGLRLGDRYIGILAASDAEQLAGQCSPAIRFEPYSTDKTGYAIPPGAWLGPDLPIEHVTNQYWLVADPATCRKELETRLRRLQSLGGREGENSVAKEAITEYLATAAKGDQKMVWMHFNVMVHTDKKAELPALQNLAITAMAKCGVTAHQETISAQRLLLSAIPGNGGELPINEFFLTFAEQAACFAVPGPEDPGPPADFGITLCDRATGIPVRVDISDEPMKKGWTNARNKAVTGPSGTGKSYFLLKLLLEYWIQLCHILVLDIGGSYKALCEFLHGRYFLYSKEQPLQFNPFWLGEGEALDTEKLESLKAMVRTLWKKPSEPFDRSEYISVSNMITGYYKYLHGAPDVFPCFDSFYDWVRDQFIPTIQADGLREKDFDYTNFLFVLRPYYKGGEYAHLLNAREQMNLLQERFIVFDIDSIKDHEILFPVVTIVIMELFVSKMRKLKSIRKVMVWEEAWKAIAKEGTNDWLKFLLKTIRKFFGEAIVATQDIEDLTSSEVIRNTIINNIDCKIFTDQRKFMNRFDETQRMFGLTDHEKVLALSLNTANDPTKRYKELLVCLGTGHSRVYRLEVSLEEHLVFTTEEPQRVKVNEYARKHGGLHTGIKALAADIRSGAVKLLLAAAIAMGFVLLPNGRASAQIIDVIDEAIKYALEEADLKIQQAQTETLYLQNAEKALENDMTGGLLDDITGWVQDQDQLFAAYYQELWQVKTAFTDFSKVTALIERQAQLVKEYQQATAAVRQDPHFSAAEVTHILNVYDGILNASIRNTTQLATVIKSFATQMDDEGRLHLIDETAAGIDRNYADLQQYTQQNTLLSLQRAKDEGDIQTIKALYGIQ